MATTTSSSSSSHYRLIYFPIRGGGELSRAILTKAGVAWTDDTITRERWGTSPATEQPSMPFHQLPVLVETDAATGAELLRLGQSHAVERFLAARLGLAGTGDRPRALADSMAESLVDLREAFRRFLDAKAAATDEAPRAAFFKALRETLAHHERFLARQADPATAVLGGGVEEGPFYLGAEMTYVDIMATLLIERFEDEFTAAALEGDDAVAGWASLPRFKALLDAVRADAVLGPYLASADRKPMTWDRFRERAAAAAAAAEKEKEKEKEKEAAAAEE
ncbi:hypothetical protein DFJ73DRAFT_959550 [Zopfochytrium polystomum]|nr:hypothetical protein DFJ73DRAFT_959550 [Zopfochytrium polystomum]